VKGQLSIETKVFKVLKGIGVELSSYHGGSLNGKDIKKVMNNASHVFDCISVVFKEGKRDASANSYQKKGGCNWDQTKKAARYRTVRSDAIFRWEQGYDTDVVGTVIQQRQGSDWRKESQQHRK
jgi:hypothetical protein